jgi:hypothetical protein
VQRKDSPETQVRKDENPRDIEPKHSTRNTRETEVQIGVEISVFQEILEIMAMGQRLVVCYLKKPKF